MKWRTWDLSQVALASGKELQNSEMVMVTQQSQGKLSCVPGAMSSCERLILGARSLSRRVKGQDPGILAAMRSNSIIDGLGIQALLGAAPQFLADSVRVLASGPSFPRSTDSRPTLSSREIRDPGVHLHGISGF